MYLRLVGPARIIRLPDRADGSKVYGLETYDRDGFVPYCVDPWTPEEDVLYDLRHHGLAQLINAIANFYLREARRKKRAKTQQ